MYAQLSRMRILSSTAVVDRRVKKIVGTYLEP